MKVIQVPRPTAEMLCPVEGIWRMGPDAEQLAALCQGFENVVEFESALRARAKKADICEK